MFEDEDVLETRTVFRDDVLQVSVIVQMFRDADVTPDEFDCYSEADVEAWRVGDWRYVGLGASVDLGGVEIGSGSLWAVEHGDLGDVEANAWALAPAATEYLAPGRSGGEPVAVTVMGSALSSVIAEALENAERWLREVVKIPDPQFPLTRALAWSLTATGTAAPVGVLT